MPEPRKGGYQEKSVLGETIKALSILIAIEGGKPFLRCDYEYTRLEDRDITRKIKFPAAQKTLQRGGGEKRKGEEGEKAYTITCISHMGRDANRGRVEGKILPSLTGS